MSGSNASDRGTRGRSRRELLTIAGSLVAGAALPAIIVRPAAATPTRLKSAIDTITGGAPVTPGRVKLDIAPLVESGATVPCTVAVDSPMTPADHVKAIHVLNEKNPQPYVISVSLGPRAGRAAFSTRIRLAGTQAVTALAEMSDGTFWSANVNVIVTLGACVEEAL